MLPPEAGSVLHTSPPRAVLTLCPAWNQSWLCWERIVAPTAPRNLPYPNVSSSRQPLQEVASCAETGSRIPLTRCILSSHPVIFTYIKLQSHLPTTTQCPFPFLF